MKGSRQETFRSDADRTTQEKSLADGLAASLQDVRMCSCTFSCPHCLATEVRRAQLLQPLCRGAYDVKGQRALSIIL